MAEVLAAVGGAAAITQLIHYGNMLVQVTSASSRHARLAPDTLRRWIDTSNMMRCMLENLWFQIGNTDQSTIYAFEQCRDDITAMTALLEPFNLPGQLCRLTRVKRASFVLRRGDEIERKIMSARSALNTIALQVIVASVTTMRDQSRWDLPAHAAFPQHTSLMPRIYDLDDAQAISEKSSLGVQLFWQGRLDEAESLQRYVYSARRRMLGETHPETIKSRSNIAMVINEMGYHLQAESIYREAAQDFEQVLGPYHGDTLKTNHNLATALHDQGKYEQAEAVITTALMLLRLQFGATHAETLDALEFRAILMHCMGRYAVALAMATELYRAREAILGHEHIDTQRSWAHVNDLVENCEVEGILTAIIPVHVAVPAF